MSIVLTILIVLVIVALAMWAIYYIPLPPGSPEFIKPMLYVLVLVAAIIFIMMKSGMAQQPKPVPQLKATKPAAASTVYGPPARKAVAPSWQRFQGAGRCEVTGAVVKCDNGYQGRL